MLLVFPNIDDIDIKSQSQVCICVLCKCKVNPNNKWQNKFEVFYLNCKC